MPLKNVLNLFDSNSKRDIIISLIRIYTNKEEINKDNQIINNKIYVIKILKEFCINDDNLIKIYFSMNILSNLILKEFIFKPNTNKSNSEEGEEILKLINDLMNIVKSNKKLRNELNKNFSEEIERFLVIDKKCENENLALQLKSLISALFDKN